VSDLRVAPPVAAKVGPDDGAGSGGDDLSGYRLRRRAARTALYAFAWITMGVIVIPLTFSVLGGFRDSQQLSAEPVGLPDPWIWENYSMLLQSGDFWRQVWNSTLIAMLTTLVVLPAASLSAFVLARYDFRGREIVYGLFTLGLLFPIAVAILPLFIVLRQVGLLSNPLGVALPQAAFALPISIVIMRPFFRAVPQALQDAARIDGCGPLRFYWYVMLPLSRPVLSTIAVITIVGSWNAFLLPLLVLIDPNQHTLPIGVNNISAQYSTDYSIVLAYTTLSMIPALIFYAVAERQIIGGLTNGAVKE
jgi:raffinose/stachyose/melibiose transport system permease protein